MNKNKNKITNNSSMQNNNSMLSNEGIRTGTNNHDILELNRTTNNYEPKIKIFDDKTIEPEPEYRKYYCAKDKSLLSYLNGSETVWRCDECLTYYDTKIQDTSLSDINDYKLVPFTDLQHYPVYDEHDPSLTFIEPINLYEIEADALESRQPDNQRIQTIHFKGGLTEAIAKGALTSKSSRQQEDELNNK
jgi:hypothetical protein